jgi:hypothetical protein
MPAKGSLSLYIRDEKVGEQEIITQPGKFGLGGGLVVGRSGPERITDDYAGDVSGESFMDLAQEARAAFAHQ